MRASVFWVLCGQCLVKLPRQPREEEEEVEPSPSCG